jgi:hypothetical protein
MGNQNPYIEEEQATQWQKKKYKRTNNDQTESPQVNGHFLSLIYLILFQRVIDMMF